MTTERKEKWTAGPYTARPETPYVAAQVWADWLLIADVFGESRETRKANAQLFAASAEMYQALSDLLAWANISEGSRHYHLAESAKAALAKARGE
jgi:hypothetical protein